jgi:hypothetical protein
MALKNSYNPEINKALLPVELYCNISKIHTHTEYRKFCHVAEISEHHGKTTR